MSKEERAAYLNQLIIPDLFDNSQEACELRMKQEMALRETIEELEQEPCDDAISREAVLKCFTLDNTKADVWNNIKALPPVTSKLIECEDCVSRQAALNEIYNTDGISNIYFCLADKINALPPVKPQYTNAEIQKMQDLEFAEIQKAYEIGKAENTEVLDKIRAEMEQIKEAEYQIYGKGSWRFVDKCLDIIDKYKASPTGAESEE